MKKLAIFDLDGTLLYTLEDLHASTNFALESEGLPARSLDEVRCFVGNGIRTLIERAVPDGCAVIRGAMHEKNAQKFIDFAVSRDVQSLLQEEEFSRRCVRTDIEPSAQLVRLDKLTLLDYDVAWASSEHEAILERWQSFLPKEGA